MAIFDNPYPDLPPVVDAGFIPHRKQDSGHAHARWWSSQAHEYLDEHGEFLGPADFCWCPEGLRESDAQLLGDRAKLLSSKVLEVGAGAAQCSRYLANLGVDVIATDIAHGMCQAALELNESTGIHVPVEVADARDLPFADEAFDIVFTSFGAIPFVPDADRIHAEAARVLKSGGRWVFSVTHPIRWAFADDPESVTAIRSYFEQDPYVELAESGEIIYAEYHRTFGDHIRDIVSAGLQIIDVVEPTWPADHTRTWGGWGPYRGKFLPGTAIFVTEKP